MSSTDEEPDPLDPVDVANGARIAEALTASSKKAASLVSDHIEFYEEVLPTVLLGVVGFWYWTAAAGDDAQEAADAVDAARTLGALFSTGDEAMENAIATGFVEVLPHPDEPGREVVELLPPVLRAELQRMEDWRPSR